VGRGDQQHEALNRSVPLLQARRSDLGLDVSYPRDRLDPDRHATAAQDHVPRAQVAGEWDRFFQADVPYRREAPLKTVKERELGLVAERWPGRIELRVQAKPDDSGVHYHVGEWDERNAPTLDTSQSPAGRAKAPRDIGLGEARAQPSLAQLITDGVKKPDDSTRGLGSLWLAVGAHAGMVGPAPLPDVDQRVVSAGVTYRPNLGRDYRAIPRDPGAVTG
jgi:hypothetical protein